MVESERICVVEEFKYKNDELTEVVALEVIFVVVAFDVNAFDVIDVVELELICVEEELIVEVPPAESSAL